MPGNLAAAVVKAGRILGSVVLRIFELEASPLLRWLMQFGGFKERLLADDLFLDKMAMECGVGIFTKVMAIIVDFILVYLPARTVSLRPAISTSAGSIAKFFHNCLDNAFQVSLSGTSYLMLQRLGAIVSETAVTNDLINARKVVDESSVGEIENVPILSTSAANGVYKAVSSNLRY